MTTETWPRPLTLDGEVDLDRDRELVTRAQRGDKVAFDTLYECYFARLERYCLRRLKDPQEAQDVTQEAFLRAWRALATFGGERRFYPWLSVIASNLCTDAMRRRQRFGQVPMADPSERDMSTGTSAEDFAMASADLDIAVQAYSRLSDRHRRVLDLREKSGLSYQDIALKEGIRVTTVETLIWRARQAFKREFRALSGSDGGLAGIPIVLLGVRMLRRISRATGRAAGSAPARISALGPQAVIASVGGAVAAAALVVASVSGGPVSVRPEARVGTHAGAVLHISSSQTGMRASVMDKAGNERTGLASRHAVLRNQSSAPVTLAPNSNGSAEKVSVGTKVPTGGGVGGQKAATHSDPGGTGASQINHQISQLVNGLIGGTASGVVDAAEQAVSNVENAVGQVTKDVATIVSRTTRMSRGDMSNTVATLKSAVPLGSVASAVGSFGSAGSALSTSFDGNSRSAPAPSSGGQPGSVLAGLFG